MAAIRFHPRHPKNQPSTRPSGTAPDAAVPCLWHEDSQLGSYRHQIILIHHDTQQQPGTPTCSLHAVALVCRTHSPRLSHRPSLPRSRVRRPTTYLRTHQLPSTSQPIYAPHNPYTDPQTPFNIHRSPADQRVHLRTPAASFKSPYRNRLESSSSLPLTFCSRRFRSRLATGRILFFLAVRIGIGTPHRGTSRGCMRNCLRKDASER